VSGGIEENSNVDASGCR